MCALVVIADMVAGLHIQQQLSISHSGNMTSYRWHKETLAIQQHKSFEVLCGTVSYIFHFRSIHCYEAH